MPGVVQRAGHEGSIVKISNILKSWFLLHSIVFIKSMFFLTLKSHKKFVKLLLELL